jgi:hypothetical protein
VSGVDVNQFYGEWSVRWLSQNSGGQKAGRRFPMLFLELTD